MDHTHAGRCTQGPKKLGESGCDTGAAVKGLGAALFMAAAVVLSGQLSYASPATGETATTPAPQVTVRQATDAQGDGLMRRLVLGNCARGVWGAPLLGAEPVDVSDWVPVRAPVTTSGLRISRNAIAAPDASVLIDILPDNSSCYVQMQGDGARRDAGALQAEILGYGTLVDSRVFSVGLSDVMALTRLADTRRVPVISINRLQGTPSVTTAIFNFGTFEEPPRER